MPNQPLKRLNLLIDEGHLHQGIKEMAQRIDEDFPERENPQGSEPVMVVVLKGGFIFAADLLTCMNRPVPVIFAAPRLIGGEVMISAEDQAMIKGRDLIVVDILLGFGISQKKIIRFSTIL